LDRTLKSLPIEIRLQSSKLTQRGGPNPKCDEHEKFETVGNGDGGGVTCAPHGDAAVKRMSTMPKIELDKKIPIQGTVVMDQANTVLSELVAAGAITAEERARMTLAACPRREQDLLAPFASNGRFHGLVIEHCSTSVAPDTAWTEYERDKNAVALARKRPLFFRVIFVPSLAQSLASNRTAKERQEFADRMEVGLRQRLEGVPARVDHLVSIIVLATQETK
jgi:hypothetical protein